MIVVVRIVVEQGLAGDCVPKFAEYVVEDVVQLLSGRGGIEVCTCPNRWGYFVDVLGNQMIGMFVFVR